MSTVLSTSESKRFSELERVIERGLKSFMEVGTALMEIRDQRLYRLTHARFNDYCHERWDISSGYARRLMDSVETVAALMPIGTIPDSESVARPLSQLSEQERVMAWVEAVESSEDGHPTASQVQQAVNNHRARINGPFASEPPSEPTMRRTKEQPAPARLEKIELAPERIMISVPNDPRQAAEELKRYFVGPRLNALIMYLKG
jgi:hypothetical protein